MLSAFIVIGLLFVWAVASLVFYVRRETKFGMKREIEAMSHSLYFLDAIGKDGEWYLFKDLSGERFLQFRRVSSDEGYDIQLAYPMVQPNAPYVEGVRKILSKRGVKFWHRLEMADNEDFPFRPEPGREDGEFLYASFGNDFKKAGEVAKEIFLDLYGVEENDKIWVTRRRNKR
jgi:hypothetical protein